MNVKEQRTLSVGQIRQWARHVHSPDFSPSAAQVRPAFEYRIGTADSQWRCC